MNNSQLGIAHVQFWYRFVDNILVCFKGSFGELSNYLTFTNKVHPKINLDIERKQDNKINVLYHNK